MASNFVPMLSSSPPPLDDCPDEDDEEFGNFTSATIQFDSSFDSPVSNDKHKPYKSGDNGVNDVTLNNDFNAFCSFSSPKSPKLLNCIKKPRKNHFNSIENDQEKQLKGSQNSINSLNLDKNFLVECRSNSPIEQNSMYEDDDDCNLDLPSSSIFAYEDRQELHFCSIENNLDKSSVDVIKSSLDDLNNGTIESVSASEILDEQEIQTNEGLAYDLNPSNIPSSEVLECGLKSEDDRHFYETENSEEFQTNFDQNYEDDFDDFQQANTQQTLDVNSVNNISIPNSSQSKKEELGFGADFNHFQENGDCDQDKSDEFDDFQSCDKVNYDCKSKEQFDDFQSYKQYESNPVETEDFDDFQGFTESESPERHGFANFETGSLDEKVHSESPEFADFEGASFSSVSDEAPSNFACTTALPNQEKNIDKITTVVNAIFPPLSESSDVFCDQPSEILEQSNKSHRLWEKLHEVEQAPGLRFQWGVSHSFQQLLRSVNIDYHSIDPIPPVEFDWTSSGLINPLDCGLAASALMDLSFLASNDTATSSPKSDHSFENEFLKPSPTPLCSEISNKTMILEELLSKNICSLPNSKTTHRPSNISQEANSVLDQLPDLSFMRAKVLMFPISNKT